jgi:hypothetical protein
MTFTFTAVVKATAAKFNFAACSRHAKCSFRVRLHTKIFGDPQKTDLQAKLNIVTEWSKKWQISLNTSKCCVLHCGINNPKLVYFINGSELLVKKSHNDLVPYPSKVKIILFSLTI